MRETTARSRILRHLLLLLGCDGIGEKKGGGIWRLTFSFDSIQLNADAYFKVDQLVAV